MNGSKYGSRKFLTTLTAMLLTAGLALAGKMDANVAMVMSAAIVGYQLANAYTTGKGKEAL